MKNNVSSHYIFSCSIKDVGIAILWYSIPEGIAWIIQPMDKIRQYMSSPPSTPRREVEK